MQRLRAARAATTTEVEELSRTYQQDAEAALRLLSVGAIGLLVTAAGLRLLERQLDEARAAYEAASCG